MVENLSAALPGVQSNASFDRDRYSIDLSTFGDSLSPADDVEPEEDF
jgi:hypothetical protein